MEATAAPITNKNRLVMRTTASVTTITIAVAKKKSTAVTSTARSRRQHLLLEIVW